MQRSPAQTTTVVCVVLLLLALPAAVILWPSPEEKKSDRPEPVREVRWVAIEPSTITEHIRVPCTVRAVDFVELSAEVPGQVVWVGADEGDTIKKDAAIVKLDPVRYQAALDRARAMLKLAELNRKRAAALYKENAGTEEARDRAIAEESTAQAAVRVAELDLEKATLSGPLDGRVERVLVEAGEYVTPGTHVADVVSIDRVEVTFEIPERDIAFVKRGRPVALSFASLADPQTGEERVTTPNVTAVADVADDRTRTYTARVLMENPDERLKPGMIGRAIMPRVTRREIVAVPMNAIISRKGRHTVWVVVDGRAKEREVTFGITDGVRVQIRTGLKPGDRLVIAGQHELIEDISVTRVEGEPL
jgi:membrane fusion protein (multidrug efflux system)